MRLKVFLNNNLDQLLTAIREYTDTQRDSRIQTIGIEHFNDSNQYVASVGYKPGEEWTGVDFTVVNVGNISQGPESLETRLNEIVAETDTKGTICHELFAGNAGELYVAVLTSAAATPATMAAGASEVDPSRK